MQLREVSWEYAHVCRACVTDVALFMSETPSCDVAARGYTNHHLQASKVMGEKPAVIRVGSSVNTTSSEMSH